MFFWLICGDTWLVDCVFISGALVSSWFQEDLADGRLQYLFLTLSSVIAAL